MYVNCRHADAPQCNVRRLFTMKLAFCVLIAGVVLASSASAYQIHSSPSNPCLFQANGTCFDLSKSYPWPARVQAGKYEFVFDPCKPLADTRCNSPSGTVVRV